MSMHRIERAVVMALGFAAGALLAVCIAPGDVFLWVATGIVLGLFTRAFFITSLGDEWAWPFAQSLHLHRREKQRPKSAAAHHPHHGH